MTGNSTKAAFDARAFRRALGNFATGVTIITAENPQGDRAGVTASSFNSVSLDPPLVLWSCIKDSRSCSVFETATHFAVHVLASDQIELSNHFSRQQDDKFQSVQWQPGIGGAPLLPGCAGRFQCETFNQIDGGDHWIFVGKVVGFDDYGRSPLCFHQGAYSVVFGHPGGSQKPNDQISSNGVGERLGKHTFFLMLQAVRAYQDRYQPKVETLGLSLIESRTLLVVNDLPGLNPEGLVVHLNAPLSEVDEALRTLTERAMIVATGNGFVATDTGRSKASECWQIADAHADEAFCGFTDEQLDQFKASLRRLIDQ